MKFILFLGPDTLALNYKSKKSLREELEKLRPLPGRIKRPDNLIYSFQGRRYCKAEIDTAEIHTMDSFFEAHRPEHL